MMCIISCNENSLFRQLSIKSNYFLQYYINEKVKRLYHIFTLISHTINGWDSITNSLTTVKSNRTNFVRFIDLVIYRGSYRIPTTIYLKLSV